MTVHCQREGCGLSWPRDPVLEVECPSCRAAPGRTCRQPSGHGTWNAQGRFHPQRDVAADRAGAYGPRGHCPLGICGMENADARRRAAELEDGDGIGEGGFHQEKLPL